MKIMMVDPLLSTPPYDEALCSALSRAGHDVIFVGRDRALDEPWRAPGVPYTALDFVNLLKPSARSWLPKQVGTLLRHLQYGFKLQKLAGLARRHQPDVIHFQWCLTPVAEHLLISLLPRHIPIIYTMHDTIPFNGGKVSSLFLFRLDALLRRFDCIIVHTESAVEEMRSRGFAETSVKCIPHGPLPLSDRSHPKKRAANPDGRLRFLLLGIMKPYKGIDVLVQAVALLDEHVRQLCRFDVAGLPEMELDRLREAIARHGLQQSIHLDPRFIPEEEMVSAFQAADVILFPYRAIEASGIFTIAIQFGRPVVASSIGIFKDFVEHDVNGLLVRPGQPGELANAIAYLALNPAERQRMGEEMTTKFASFPNWDLIAAKTIETYSTAIDTIKWISHSHRNSRKPAGLPKR